MILNLIRCHKNQCYALICANGFMVRDRWFLNAQMTRPPIMCALTWPLTHITPWGTSTMAVLGIVDFCALHLLSKSFELSSKRHVSMKTKKVSMSKMWSHANSANAGSACVTKQSAELLNLMPIDDFITPHFAVVWKLLWILGTALAANSNESKHQALSKGVNYNSVAPLVTEYYRLKLTRADFYPKFRHLNRSC